MCRLPIYTQVVAGDNDKSREKRSESEVRSEIKLVHNNIDVVLTIHIGQMADPSD